MQIINTAEASTRLSALIAQVEQDGQPILLARRGRPVAAIVSLDDLACLPPRPEKSAGALALVGAWSAFASDEEIDQMIKDIYEQRR